MSNRIVATPGDRLELLETFVRIADAGGISAAARSMDTAQPTVSRRLQQLEAMLDVKLVERNTHSLSLTQAGATLLPEARQVVERWQGLETALGGDTEGYSGVVRVAASREIGAGLMPALLAEFFDSHPDVRVDLRFFDSSAESAGDDVDFIICEGKAQREDAVSAEIGKVRRVLATSTTLAQRIAEMRGVAIQSCEPLALEGAPLVSSSSLYRNTLRFHGRRGETEEVSFERVASLEGLEPTLNMALLGIGIAILPTWRIMPMVNSGQLMLVSSDWYLSESPVTLSWSPSRFRSPSATAFMELVREELPHLLGCE